jgi:uncharacterized membrane protein
MPETTTVSPEPAVQESADATISTSTSDMSVDMTLSGGEKMLCILGYIGFLCVLPLILKPKSEMCQHHGKQALAVTLLFFLASAVVSNFAIFVGTSGALLKFSVVINIAWTVVAIMGMMGATAGKKSTIPFFGMVAKKFDW